MGGLYVVHNGRRASSRRPLPCAAARGNCSRSMRCRASTWTSQPRLGCNRNCCEFGRAEWLEVPLFGPRCRSGSRLSRRPAGRGVSPSGTGIRIRSSGSGPFAARVKELAKNVDLVHLDEVQSAPAARGLDVPSLVLMVAIVPGLVDLLNRVLFPTETIAGTGATNAAQVLDRLWLDYRCRCRD